MGDSCEKGAGMRDQDPLPDPVVSLDPGEKHLLENNDKFLRLVTTRFYFSNAENPMFTFTFC